MSEIATYSFLPWLRQGIANQISGQSGSRATIPVELTLTADEISGGATSTNIPRDVQLYGPGDIVGIDQQAIVKMEPNDRITNFEPNYLPYLEFYDEDFPWRYSPLPNPTGSSHRLTPWICLIVLREDEFEETGLAPDAPLPAISITADNPSAVLPPSDQLSAWAHVHVNKGLLTDIRSTDSSAIQAALETALNSNPDLAYARLMCPRRLSEQTTYHAFLVPTFESGRLAGLGQDPNTATFDQLAWSTGSAPTQLPFYHRWAFRTGAAGDFEYLVRLLEAKPVDKRVGVRDMDVQRPGANIAGITDAQLEGILKLGGALRVPRINYTDEEYAIVESYDNWDQPLYPHPFQRSLASFINLTDDYQQHSALTANNNSAVNEARSPTGDPEEYSITGNPDPIITAPLYGRWHALTQRLLKDRAGNDLSNIDNWVHELNLDPRWRVAAGIGTKIIQSNQERYMEAAWKQVGDILKALQKIRAAQLAEAVSKVWYETSIRPMAKDELDKWIAMASPLRSRIRMDGLTVHAAVRNAKLPLAATSLKMRQTLRPRGKIAAKRLKFKEDAQPQQLVSKLNAGVVTAAPPKQTPDGTFTFDELAHQLQPENLQKVSEDIKNLSANLPKSFQSILDQTIQLISGFGSNKVCVDFRSRGDTALKGPHREENLVFRAFEYNGKELPELRVVGWGKEAGLDASFRLEITFPCDTTEITMVLSDFSAPPLLIALDANGEVIEKKQTLRHQAPHEVRHTGGARTIIVESPQNETLIHEVCYTCKDSNGEKEDRLRKQTENLKEPYYFKRPSSELNSSSNFRLANPLEPYDILYDGKDNEEAVQFKLALDELNKLFLESYELGRVAEKPSLQLAQLGQHTFEKLNPRQTIPRWTYANVFIPGHIKVQLPEVFVEPMAYPEFDTPMYKPLVKESEDLFLPNIQYVEQNSITLLESNQRFIEAYMVGLNHEFARELLWREYPTDQRGSYFRQFWEVSSYLGDPNIDPEALKEQLRDIPPIHRWPRASKLGEHDHREQGGSNEEEVVLVIRGELLKKYPNTVIYAQRAEWGGYEDAAETIPDLTKERVLAEFDESDPAAIRDTIKTPLYEAKVNPDINFFGFDLTACAAKGGPGEQGIGPDPACADANIPWDDPGWFFVIKERPGEPRFGLDIAGDSPETPDVWNDLSWEGVSPAAAPESFLQVGGSIPLSTGLSLPDEQEKQEQRDEDVNINWNTDISSAELAYILYQVPVLVAIHASEMLPTN